MLKFSPKRQKKFFLIFENCLTAIICTCTVLFYTVQYIYNIYLILATATSDTDTGSVSTTTTSTGSDCNSQPTNRSTGSSSTDSTTTTTANTSLSTGYHSIRRSTKCPCKFSILYSGLNVVVC